MNEESARRFLTSLYRAALRGVDPRERVGRALDEPDVARALRGARAVGVFAVGKAAEAMMRGARVGPARRLLILPHGFPCTIRRRVEVLFASHPEPDRSSVQAARRALAFFGTFGSDDVILCLVSGGSSSLLALPRKGLTLEKKRRAVDRLIARGASILEINRLRTRLSAVKGGDLGRSTGARLVTLVLSDVPGDRASVVGSGPTIRGRAGDLVRVVGSNRAGLSAAAAEARRLGWVPRLARDRLRGEAREAGANLVRRAGRLEPGETLLCGGETIVALPRRHGRGGRNLEVALGAALEIDAASGLVVLAAGSDGRDGGSDAAGAFADRTTLVRARRLGLDAARALRRHDTDDFFLRLGDRLVTGPTGTNVADWAFAARPRRARRPPV